MKTKDADPFFGEEYDAQATARAIARAVLSRVLIWLADSPTLEDRGLRATVCLYCVRPELIDGATLEEIGEATGRTRQWVHALVESFRHTTGYRHETHS